MHRLYLYQHITSSPEEYFTGAFDRQQRREKSNILWQTWVGGMLTIAPVMLIWARLATAPCSAVLVFCCDCLCWAVWPTIWTSVPLSFKKKRKEKNKRRKKTCCTCVPSKEKAKWEPSVRCYKLLARPVARPREPDLAAPRLRRVKHCTQRSSLHLYAPYIGRLLLQPTSTWLLAS